MRLFTALYPPPEVLAHLDLALGGVGGPAVADPGAGLRWVPPQQRHVTLAFHGEVPDGAVPAYVDALREELRGAAPFELALAGSGSFGGRTLWVGLSGDTVALRRLAGVVTAAAADAGLPAADRAGGRPHLTVARASASRTGAARDRAGRRGPGRAREPDVPFTTWAHALAVYTGPRWTTHDVHVVGSRLGDGPGGGPLHTAVAVVPLEAD